MPGNVRHWSYALATHGAPSERNAHPHTDCTNKIAVVHNGIIENFAELREELIAKGHTFTSDTDTECIAHLVEENYHGDLFEAVRVVSNSLSGAYGLAVMHHDHPGRNRGNSQRFSYCAGRWRKR